MHTSQTLFAVSVRTSSTQVPVNGSGQITIQVKFAQQRQERRNVFPYITEGRKVGGGSIYLRAREVGGPGMRLAQRRTDVMRKEMKKENKNKEISIPVTFFAAR